jgi:hypothetical protein
MGCLSNGLSESQALFGVSLTAFEVVRHRFWLAALLAVGGVGGLDLIEQYMASPELDDDACGLPWHGTEVLRFGNCGSIFEIFSNLRDAIQRLHHRPSSGFLCAFIVAMLVGRGFQAAGGGSVALRSCLRLHLLHVSLPVRCPGY